MYDCIIIGGGPAGVSSAINLKLLGKSFLWFSSAPKKVERAELIKNYPAFPSITGKELNEAFQKHIESLGIEMREEVVTGVYETDGHFTLLVQDKQYTAKTVILCLGVETSKPIDGEEEFLGRGVSYCATCDGFLYKGKKIAVLCTDKKFEHEAEFLCGIAEKAYVIPLYKGYEIKSPNAQIILKKPISVSGDMRLRKVNFKDESFEIDGMFILRGSVSPSTLVHGLKIEDGHIFVNRDCSTNIAGVFAAGDCTGRPYQYAKAVGEGNIAVHSVVEYLNNITR
ncbi:MAG: NAD(P)/FAD-dependent oxidoreductase [Clostridia bacterium]|nr:NAD(P)/FAD-dependent oxidoreductase [Clostridia bacterium]